MKYAVPFAVAFALSTTAAVAQESSALPVLHGFGSAGYGKNSTDVNHYDASSPEGDYRHASLALSVAAQPVDKLRLNGQLHFENDEGESAAEIDLAFAEWRFSDSFRLRAGRLKQSFGIYNEVFDVGTLRPFSFLPQGIYASGLLSEGLNAVGFGGSRRGSTSWGVQYDGYLGGVDVEGEPLRETFGGHVVVETPVTGLSFGVSGFSGSGDEGRHSVAGVQGEYLAGPWSLRTEYLHAWLHGDASFDAGYVELARRFGPNWQLAARYDVGSPSDEDAADHEDIGVSVNYWFTPGFVTKVAYHHVDGNLFAAPEDAGVTPDPETDAFFVTAQFSF